jgi:DNA replication licensing factor MCM4
VSPTEGDYSANEKYYYQKLSDYGLDIGSDVFSVKGTHLKEFNQEIYYQFIYFPAEMISCFDAVLKTLYELFFITNEMDENIVRDRLIKKEKLMLGITNLEKEDISKMRNLTPKDINRLVCIRGIVIRCSEIYP